MSVYFDRDSLNHVLAVPDELLRNPDLDFNLTFRSWTWLKHIIMLTMLFMLSRHFIYYLLENKDYFEAIIIGCIASIFAIFLLFGFINSLRVISIKLDNFGATFRGSIGTRRLLYQDILFISNDRYINGRGRLSGSDGFWGFGMPRIPMARPREPATVVLGDLLDASSTSHLYTNRITISTARANVKFVFSGGDNSGYVKALAIIIYLAKYRNPRCRVSDRAVKAASRCIDLCMKNVQIQ